MKWSDRPMDNERDNTTPTTSIGKIIDFILDRTRSWGAGIWSVFMIGCITMAALVTLLIMFILTLFFM